QRLFLVYSPGRGTFYPFAPRPPDSPGAGHRRNNTVETKAREVLASELDVEPDTARWFPVWDAPDL
ncbi:MAG: PspA-associated protein PspAB, partial [Actinomycetes bacterium]